MFWGVIRDANKASGSTKVKFFLPPSWRTPHLADK
jgi:hypothetical protein